MESELEQYITRDDTVIGLESSIMALIRAGLYDAKLVPILINMENNETTNNKQSSKEKITANEIRNIVQIGQQIFQESPIKKKR